MKNVLFIVYYFPPMGGSGVQRPLKFVKYLRKFGWNPIILCPQPGAYSVFDESLTRELAALGLEIHRVAGNTPLHAAGRRRKVVLPRFIEQILRKISVFFWLPDNKKNWIKLARRKALEIVETRNIDLIFATASPYSNLMLAADLKKETGIPVVMDLRDEWLKSHLIHYPTAWHKQKMQAIENKTLQQADILTVINNAYKESFSERYPKLNIEVIRQGFDPEDFTPATAPKSKTGKLRLLYSGLFYGERRPDLLFESLSEMFREQEGLREQVELHFQGGLDRKSMQVIKKLKLENNVINHGYLNHKEAVKNLMRADVLWLIVGHRRHAEKVTVGKMFEYFGTGKPVLALAQKGGTTELLEKYGAGYTADPYSKAEIKKALESVLHDFKNNRLPVANDKFVAQYNRLKITGDLASLFDRAVLKSRNTLS